MAAILLSLLLGEILPVVFLRGYSLSKRETILYSFSNENGVARPRYKLKIHFCNWNTAKYTVTDFDSKN